MGGWFNYLAIVNYSLIKILNNNNILCAHATGDITQDIKQLIMVVLSNLFLFYFSLVYANAKKKNIKEDSVK